MEICSSTQALKIWREILIEPRHSQSSVLDVSNVSLVAYDIPVVLAKHGKPKLRNRLLLPLISGETAVSLVVDEFNRRVEMKVKICLPPKTLNSVLQCSGDIYFGFFSIFGARLSARIVLCKSLKLSWDVILRVPPI